jgi:hypothetical protein
MKYLTIYGHIWDLKRAPHEYKPDPLTFESTYYHVLFAVLLLVFTHKKRNYPTKQKPRIAVYRKLSVFGSLMMVDVNS